MVLNDVSEVRRVACIGAGPIGGGWSAHFLAKGFDVTCYLHDPDACLFNAGLNR